MSLRQTVLLVALLNLAYFGVEFGVALAIGSVSLFADSVDFLEDASINLLIAVGLGWSAQTRARLGLVLAAIILVPVAATLWTAWQKFLSPVPPQPILLTLTGFGALLVNLACAFLLVRFRHHCGSRPQDDPQVEDHRRFVGPRQGFIKAKPRSDLNDKDDEQGQEQTAANRIGGFLKPLAHA
jgi:Co/Zn/Cd efflux system component